MDRVKTLIEKLQQQSDSGASAAAMLSTSQMLQAELTLLSGNKGIDFSKKISVIMPVTQRIFTENENGAASIKEEKIVEVLQVNEQEIEKELAEIKKHAETMQSLGQHNAPGNRFDPLEEVPTLAHQDRIPESEKLFQSKIEYPEGGEFAESLNDKLKQVRTELSQTLTSTPIKDLRKAIGVNDRFLFMNELFRGDEVMYERSIKTIQGFSIFAEAEYWIRRELKLKLGWNNNDAVVRQFDELVRRRFM